MNTACLNQHTTQQYKEFDQEDYYMNVIAAELCPKFLDLYLVPTLKVTTPNLAKISVYERQLIILNKIFDLLIHSIRRMTMKNPRRKPVVLHYLLKMIQRILNEIKSVTGVKEYAECVFLFEIHDQNLRRGSQLV